MTEKDRRFWEWIDAMASKDYPPVTSLLGPPGCARQTVEKPVEPYHTHYKRLSNKLPWFEDGPPPRKWYKPTRKLLELQERVENLRNKAFRTVPNPDYTEECAKEWEQNRRKPYGQTRITVGQSYNPDVSHE
jgi:hypothetical protein